MKRIFAIAMFIVTLSLSTAYAQDDEQLVSGSITLSPQYLWRGFNYANGLVSTHDLNLNVGGFSFCAEGIFNLIGDGEMGHYKEINLYASYTLDSFTLTLADYYSPDTAPSYFVYDNHETDHILEASLTFEPESVPIWATVATYIWGADKDIELWEKQLYSTYLEVGGYYDFDDNNTLLLTVGAGLPNSAYSNYTNKFAICNMDLTYEKRIELGDLTMPLSLTVAANPFMKQVFANCALGISF